MASPPGHSRGSRGREVLRRNSLRSASSLDLTALSSKAGSSSATKGPDWSPRLGSPDPDGGCAYHHSLHELQKRSVQIERQLTCPPLGVEPATLPSTPRFAHSGDTGPWRSNPGSKQAIPEWSSPQPTLSESSLDEAFPSGQAGALAGTANGRDRVAVVPALIFPDSNRPECRSPTVTNTCECRPHLSPDCKWLCRSKSLSPVRQPSTIQASPARTWGNVPSSPQQAVRHRMPPQSVFPSSSSARLSSGGARPAATAGCTMAGVSQWQVRLMAYVSQQQQRRRTPGASTVVILPTHAQA